MRLKNFAPVKKFFFLIVLSILAVDQGIKFLVLRFFPGQIDYNPGAAFSLGANTPELILVIVSLVLIFLFWMGIFWSNGRTVTILAIIFGGALANFLDRLFRPGVLDYWHLPFWPSFNFADVVVVVGCLLLLIEWAKKPVETRKNKNPEE